MPAVFPGLVILKQESEETDLTRALTVLTGCYFMSSKKMREMWPGREKAFTFRRLFPFLMAQENEDKLYLTTELIFKKEGNI